MRTFQLADGTCVSVALVDEVITKQKINDLVWESPIYKYSVAIGELDLRSDLECITGQMIIKELKL